MYYGCSGNYTVHPCRFIAIYADLSVIKTTEQKYFFIAMNFIEVVGHIIATFVVTLSIGTVRNCARFHPNIVRIFLFFISHSYIYSTSRFVIFFFQNGVIEIESLGGIAYHFLMVFSYLRIYHLFSCVFVFTAFCAERFLATIYLEEYETRRCPTASIVILATVYVISTLLAVDTTCADAALPLPMKLAIVGVVTLASGATLVEQASLAMHSHNLRVCKEMKEQPHRYRLSTRFQIVENCRAFELLRNVAVVSTTGIALATVGLVYSLFILTDPAWASIAGTIFDTLNAIVFTAVIIMCCFSQPFWRDEFKTKLGIEKMQAFSYNYDLIIDKTIKSKRAIVVHPFTTSESIRESYFAGLNKTWEAKQRPSQLMKH